VKFARGSWAARLESSAGIKMLLKGNDSPRRHYPSDRDSRVPGPTTITKAIREGENEGREQQWALHVKAIAGTHAILMAFKPFQGTSQDLRGFAISRGSNGGQSF
jgi:hypothetical protein